MSKDEINPDTQDENINHNPHDGETGRADVEAEVETEVEAESTEAPKADAEFKQASRDSRPALTPPKEFVDRVVALLDITEKGIGNDATLMEMFFPRANEIMQRASDVTSLTVEEIAELSRYSLAKAIFASDSYNPIVGMLDNQLHHPDGTTFGASVVRPVEDDDDELNLDDVGSLEVEISGGGIINYPMTNSGFRIRMQPFGVSERIKLEETILHRIGEFGRSTVGGGILALDAIIINSIIDLIIGQILETNIKDLELDAKGRAKLRELINHKDIRPLVGVMNHIMHMDGYEYGIPCDQCGHVEVMTLNVIRSMQHDHGKLSESQLNQLRLPLESEISVKRVRQYQEEFVAHQKMKEFKLGKRTYRVHTRAPSIAHKMKSYSLMFNLLERLARETVGMNGVAGDNAVNEKGRELLTRMWHLHYIPFISSIDVVSGERVKTAKKQEVILELLKSISIADETGDVAAFLTEVAYDNVVTFATHIPPCTSCGAVVEELRNYDPVMDFFIRRTSHHLTTSIVQEVMMLS